MRVQAHPNLSASRFVLPGLTFGATFAEVDPSDPVVREALITYAGTHIRVHSDDLFQLELHGLALDAKGKIAEASHAAQNAAIAEVEQGEARRRARRAAGDAPALELPELVDPAAAAEGDAGETEETDAGDGKSQDEDTGRHGRRRKKP